MDSLFEFLEKSVNANYFTGFGLATTRIIGFPNNNNMRYLFCKQGKILLQESDMPIGFKSVYLEETVNYSRMIFK